MSLAGVPVLHPRVPIARPFLPFESILGVDGRGFRFPSDFGKCFAPSCLGTLQGSETTNLNAVPQEVPGPIRRHILGIAFDRKADVRKPLHVVVFIWAASGSQPQTKIGAS